MPDPPELLAVARLLADAGARPSDGQLRRAVSTAYYAVFHRVLRAGVERFVGAGNAARPGYTLIYRGYSHGRIRAVCTALDAASLGANVQRQLKTSAASQDMRDFASAFVALHANRQRADYDPQAAFSHSETIATVAEAASAIEAFDRKTDEERAASAYPPWRPDARPGEMAASVSSPYSRL